MTQSPKNWTVKLNHHKRNIFKFTRRTLKQLSPEASVLKESIIRAASKPASVKLSTRSYTFKSMLQRRPYLADVIKLQDEEP